MVSIKFWVSGKISKYIPLLYILLFKNSYWLNIPTEERQPDFFLNSNVAKFLKNKLGIGIRVIVQYYKFQSYIAGNFHLKKYNNNQSSAN